MSFYRRFGKRAVDVVVGSVGLLVASPLILILSFLVRTRLGAPVWFLQQRPGLHGQPFTIIKFRTMTDAVDAEGNLLPDAQRLTAFGRFLRSTSLDELPELINVVRGEMSLVGPRPLLIQYLARYNAQQMRRHEVRPGITGWAQVTGRNSQSWAARFTADVWYVDHVSFALDLKILGLTITKVIAREGITAQGHATIAEFRGNEQ